MRRYGLWCVLESCLSIQGWSATALCLHLITWSRDLPLLDSTAVYTADANVCCRSFVQSLLCSLSAAHSCPRRCLGCRDTDWTVVLSTCLNP